MQLAKFGKEEEEFVGDEERAALLLSAEKDPPCSSSKKPAASIRRRKLALHMLISFLVLLHLAANINYLAFKARLYTREFRALLAAPWLLLILLCECVYFLSSLIAAIDHVMPPVFRPDPPELDGKYIVEYPTVHILLPCCKEPTEVPQESIRAALAMNYPQDRFKVLVLDDGGDDDLRAFCEALQAETGGQVVYLRRVKVPGVPHHFKCGNLNYGLQHSDAEYVVMMDADMILHPSFLRRLLPYIVNSPNVSFVQIPQSFYNLPIGDPLNDACIFGYERVMVHRNSFGTASCLGTGAIFRRKHLDEIGGFQPQSITEDTTTAYALFNQGYRSVYLNEKLQIGLTPWTFEGYIKQRQRWGQGAIQQFLATRKSMLGKGSKLNGVQKVYYFWHTGYYYVSIVNITLAMVLLSALAFRLNLNVGDAKESRKLIAYLAIYLVLWRVEWMCIFLAVPLPIQCRNREESHFWWMTPFYFKMIMQAIFSYSSTFKFVPTSNIDRAAAAASPSSAAGGKTSAFLKHLSTLKHVRVHIAYAFLVLSVVACRASIAARRRSLFSSNDCTESFFVLGLSVFLLATSAHMLVPVLSIVWPTSFKPAQRKSLLRYDADGVPTFCASDCRPKWYWPVIFYEMISYTTLAFWMGVLYIVATGADFRWCKEGSL